MSYHFYLSQLVVISFPVRLIAKAHRLFLREYVIPCCSNHHSAILISLTLFLFEEYLFLFFTSILFLLAEYYRVSLHLKPTPRLKAIVVLLRNLSTQIVNYYGYFSIQEAATIYFPANCLYLFDLVKIQSLKLLFLSYFYL